MIALRGRLERTKKEPTEGAPQQPTTTPATTSDAPATTAASDTYEWTWQGHWAFGLTLPQDEKKWQKFVYKWEKPVDPAEILVISLNYAGDDDDDDGDDDDEEEREEATNPTMGSESTNQEQASATPTPTSTAASATTAMEIDSTTGASNDNPKDASVEAAKGNKKEVPTDKKGKVTEDTQQSASVTKAMDVDQKPAVDSSTSALSADDKKQPATVSVSVSSPPQSVKFEGISSAPESTEAPHGDAAKAQAEPTTKPPKRPKITFATVDEDDPPFTDASTKHPDKCPTGGVWKGYFENAIKPLKQRKHTPVAPQIQKIAETFHIYMNVTPATDAQTWFPTEKKKAAAALSGTSPAEGLLKEGQIHVRGTGTNQFGTFELLGSFDVATGMLECQRMYVTNLEAPPTTPKRRRSSSAQGLAEGAALASTASKSGDDGRPYFTRKRPMSWKRRAMGGSDSEGDGTTPTGAARKRANSAGGAGAAGAAKRVRVTEPKAGEVVSAAPKGVAPGGGLSITIPGKRPGPSPKGTPRSKKVSTGGSGGGTTPKEPRQQILTPAASTSNTYMKLPAVGDPKLAHWRAAHYLYYQKNDPLQEEGGSGGNSGSGGTPAAGNAYKYVVYEGEMFKSQREGRGVCLYSNQMIYEGK